ncbi:MAG: hypothetical protein R2769_09660 [Saprospiraceae bacterium]
MKFLVSRLSMDTWPNDPYDCNSRDGRISLTAAAGHVVGGLTYSINGGTTWSNSSIFNSLQEGDYSIKGKKRWCMCDQWR